ncbi:MAG: IMS domain-containing protein [Leptolyngbyaceae cyanobacterium bins.302]|nr:IMS domain-containing protein [Leptolyngbyaceae cyanobacterium bins.302]
MRIPLDYYRILGLPIQATSDQLRQAHRDRTLQLPRREYSDAAIAARKQLLDQAYTVLANPDQRKRYDSGFLAKTYDLGQEPAAVDGSAPSVAPEDSALVDPHTPSVEIEDDQFIGALLILQELGEYELVLKLGRPFLTGGSASLQDHHYGDPAIVFSDIVLTVALACLELGREQWQQGQYENAAEALETGQQLLLREGLFVNVRGEIQSDLYRLRPYRILELLAAPETYAAERRTGMELLEEMLRERGGIDGNQNDQSGLSVDDFLKFIQQLRSYLSAEEQQYLFEQEANRPSAVATFLTVYALLARGFAERQPELVQQAKEYLARLNSRQDVHLEQAIGALLLGQTEAASQALEQSQEQESIDFIRQHSYSSPDLLPGLCLYTERWFHDEVFPHFRDLVHCRISLKEYFADRQVQSYLEALPSDVEASVAPVMPIYSSSQRDALTSQRAASPSYAAESSDRADLELVAATHRPYENREGSVDHDTQIAAARARIASRGGTATLGSDGRFPGSVSTAERVEREMDQDSPVSTQPRSQWSRSRNEPSKNGDDSDVMAPRKAGDRPAKARSSRTPGWLIPASALLGIILLGALAAWLFKSLSPASRSTAQNDEPLLIQLDKPLLELADETTDPTAVQVVDQAAAQQLISTWLAAKSKAMGSTYDVAALDQILTDPKLAEWRSAADEAKRDGWYRTYKHDVTVESVELISSTTGQVISTQAATPTPATGATGSATAQPSPDAIAANPSPTTSPDAAVSPSATVAPEATTSPSPAAAPDATSTTTPTSPSPTAIADQARVIASVSETTETYRNGKASGSPQTEQLRVQYSLVQKDGKWRIQDWQIL